MVIRTEAMPPAWATPKKTILGALSRDLPVAQWEGAEDAQRNVGSVECFEGNVAETGARRRGRKAHVRPDQADMRGQAPERGGAKREGETADREVREVRAAVLPQAVNDSVIAVHAVGGDARRGDHAGGSADAGRVQRAVLEVLPDRSRRSPSR
jgi:hypothetical protein